MGRLFGNRSILYNTGHEKISFTSIFPFYFFGTYIFYIKNFKWNNLSFTPLSIKSLQFNLKDRVYNLMYRWFLQSPWNLKWWYQCPKDTLVLSKNIALFIKPRYYRLISNVSPVTHLNTSLPFDQVYFFWLSWVFGP